MASTAGDTHSLPPSPATSPTAFLDDHPSFLRSPSSSPTFLLDLPGVVPFAAAAVAGAQEQHNPTVALHQAADQRKPPRKRPRAASRRPPTTVLTTDASNFRAMVQEFTGFPAPPPFSCGALPSSHILSGDGVLFPSGSAPAPAFQAMRASSPATNTTSLVLDALAMLAKTRAIATAAAAAAPASSGSDLYGGYGRHMLAGAVPFDDGFEAADGEIAGVAAGHGLFSSSSPFAGESRY
uniref:VQ domain-containing protein n=1 Tax=Oryza punctata TaxID=4537 RepID=A0A0E0LNJ6_ORYPU